MDEEVLLDVPWDWDRALEELDVTAIEYEAALAAGQVETRHPRDLVVTSDDSDLWDHFRELRLTRPGRRPTIAWVPASAARDHRLVPRGRLALGVRAIA